MFSNVEAYSISLGKLLVIKVYYMVFKQAYLRMVGIIDNLTMPPAISSISKRNGKNKGKVIKIFRGG